MPAGLCVFPRLARHLVDPFLQFRRGPEHHDAARQDRRRLALPGTAALRAPFSRTVKLPNDEIFTSSPADSRSAIASMNPFTSSAASPYPSPISSQTASVSSRLVTVAMPDRPSRSASPPCRVRDLRAALYQRSETPDISPCSGASSLTGSRRVPPRLMACDRPNPRRGPADDDCRPGGCAAAHARTGCCSGRRAGCAAPGCARRHPGFVPRTADPPSRCARRLAPLPAGRCARWNNPGASGARGRNCAIARLKQSDYRAHRFPCDPRRPDPIALRPRRWRPGMAELQQTRG